MVLNAKGVLALGVVVGVLAYLAKRQAVQAAEAVGAAVNPVSNQNIFYKGVNAVTGAVSGNKWYITDIFGANKIP